MDYTWFDWLTPTEIDSGGVARLEQCTAARAAGEHLVVRSLTASRADSNECPWLPEHGPNGDGVLFRIDIDAEDLVLIPVTTADHLAVLERLAELYWHDLSEYKPIGFDVSGRFFIGNVQPDPERSKTAYLAHDACSLSGFAVVDAADDRRSIEEFFVLRGHRRRRVGTRMAQRLLNDHPGAWCLSAIKSNHASRCGFGGRQLRA